MKNIACFMLLLTLTSVAVAVPTLQVYIPGASVGSQQGDEDTWFYSSKSGSFDLTLVAAFGPNTKSITDCRLVASVPEGQTGAISVSGASIIKSGADVDVLTNTTGKDAYSDKDFLPDNFNSHDPFKSSVSDFVVFNVGSFSNVGPIHNYDADTGKITVAGSGQERTFSVIVTGFETVHFDMYGYITDKHGKKLVCSWEINPGSHDAAYKCINGTVVPAPGAALLVMIGSGIVGFVRRHRR